MIPPGHPRGVGKQKKEEMRLKKLARPLSEDHPSPGRDREESDYLGCLIPGTCHSPPPRITLHRNAHERMFPESRTFHIQYPVECGPLISSTQLSALLFQSAWKSSFNSQANKAVL